jgi:hypothetical protein
MLKLEVPNYRPQIWHINILGLFYLKPLPVSDNEVDLRALLELNLFTVYFYF